MKTVQRKSRRIATMAIAAMLAIGMVFAEEVIVGTNRLVVRTGKGSMWPPVAELAQNDKLQIVEKQSDGWLKVKVGEKEGFVKESALTARSAAALTGTSGGSQASNVDASAAARGINENTQIYANTKGMSYAGLDQMLAHRNAVAGEPWVQFAQQGKVGPAK